MNFDAPHYCEGKSGFICEEGIIRMQKVVSFIFFVPGAILFLLLNFPFIVGLLILDNWSFLPFVLFFIVLFIEVTYLYLCACLIFRFFKKIYTKAESVHEKSSRTNMINTFLFPNKRKIYHFLFFCSVFFFCLYLKDSWGQYDHLFYIFTPNDGIVGYILSILSYLGMFIFSAPTLLLQDISMLIAILLNIFYLYVLSCLGHMFLGNYFQIKNHEVRDTAINPVEITSDNYDKKL